MIEPATIRNHPERFLATTAWALARGYPLGRRLTPHERLLIAVIAAGPTNTLTVHSEDASRSEMAHLFRLLVKRINRAPRQTRPLVYFATVASAQGGTRYHVHALLWDYLHAPVVIGHCTALGLGKPLLRQLPSDATGNVNYWEQVAYPMTQHEPAFGSRRHRRHEQRLTSARRFMYPQDATLAKHCAQLLSALQLARDPTVSDETLCASLPKFSNTSSSGGKRNATANEGR